MLEKLLLKNIKNDKLKFLPTDEIVPNPSQPRKEFDEDELCSLSDSIRQFGVLQPIAVRRRKDPPQLELNNVSVTAPQYEIIAGERRWRAAVRVGLKSMPCLIYDATDEESSVLALIENMQRKELGIFEEAAALQGIITMSGITQTQLAKQLSVSQSALSNKLRLLKLTKSERKIISDFDLTERHARALIRIENLADRERILRRAAARGLTASETEALVEDHLRIKEQPKPESTVRKIKGSISDLKFFYNTIDNAVSSLQTMGFRAGYIKSKCGQTTEIVIRIEKKEKA